MLHSLNAVLYQSFPGLFLVQTNQLTYLQNIKRSSHKNSPVAVSAQNDTFSIFANLDDREAIIEEILPLLSVILEHTRAIGDFKNRSSLQSHFNRSLLDEPREPLAAIQRNDVTISFRTNLFKQVFNRVSTFASPLGLAHIGDSTRQQII